MGIKGLWTVFAPYSEKKSLSEIRGETVAVDLSGWICDSQNVTDYYIQPKLYLRNIFFRTAYLILADINPIFVLDGDAPELKRDVMAARNAIQFKGAAPKSQAAEGKRKPDVARKRFKGVLKECENMLRCMGISCIKGDGEAEALCAQLNAQGVVDAIVSQDSDCFAYGANCVYRNFSVSNSAGGGALQGSVECYHAEKIMDSNGFGRNKMVALALLCGCDYATGACGSSITTAVSFLHTVPDKDVIPRLVSWVSDADRYSELSRWVSYTCRACQRCGHAGRSHANRGCPVCGTHKGCKDTEHKNKLTDVKRELSLRERALSCGSLFPEPRVIKEFLNTPTQLVSMDALRTTLPSLVQFVKLMTYKMDWPERYCVEKFLPLLTKYHLKGGNIRRTLQPVAIKKKRTPKGIPSYEVVWSDIDGQYEGLVPDDQFQEHEDRNVLWTTIERQDLVRQCYPDVVDTFEQSIKKPTKLKSTTTKKTKGETNPEKPKRKYNRKTKQKDKDIEQINKSLSKINITLNQSKTNKSLNVSIKVNKLRRKIKSNKRKSQKTLTSFLCKRKRKSIKNEDTNICEQLSEIDREYDMLVGNCNNKENVNHSVIEISSDSINDSELSNIVSNIVTHTQPTKTVSVNNKIVKLRFDQKISTPNKLDFKKSVLNEIKNSTPNNSPIRLRDSYRFDDSIIQTSNINDSYRLNNSFAQKSRINDSCKFDNSKFKKSRVSNFFDKMTDDCDAFETSLDFKSHADIDCDDDNTREYSYGNLVNVIM